MNTKFFSQRKLARSLMIAGLCTGLSGMQLAYAADVPQQQLSGASEVAAGNRDTAINTRVMVNLKSKASLDQSDIRVATNQAVVTLTGSSDSEQARQLAGTSAQAIAGVKRVQNDLIVVAAASPAQPVYPQADSASGTGEVSDGWITTKIQSEMLADRGMRSYSVRVGSRSGAVVLQGTLENQQQVQHVSELVGAIKGVKSVDVSALTISAK
jgi:hyperosmotically inducible protein